MRQHSFSVQEERCDRGESLGARCPRAVGFLAIFISRRVLPLTPFCLGGAGGRVAPPVGNNDDFIERQCLHFLLKKIALSFLTPYPPEFIAGSGFFVPHSFLRATLAWDSFGEKNSTPDFPTFKAKIMKYRSKNGKTEIDSGPGGLEP